MIELYTLIIAAVGVAATIAMAVAYADASKPAYEKVPQKADR